MKYSTGFTSIYPNIEIHGSMYSDNWQLGIYPEKLRLPLILKYICTIYDFSSCWKTKSYTVIVLMLSCGKLEQYLSNVFRTILFFLNMVFVYLLINLFLAVLGLRCCAQAFSSPSEWGLLSSCSAWAQKRWRACSRAQAQ